VHEEREGGEGKGGKEERGGEGKKGEGRRGSKITEIIWSFQKVG